MKNRKGIFLGIVTSVFLVLPLIVFAAGGGGGGGGSETPPPPSCSVDTWECSGWGACSTEGKQTRICSLTFNCPTANTPKPAETQGCEPPAPTSAPTAPAPTAAPQPAVSQPAVAPETKTPATKITTKLACTESEVTCGEWSQCKENGHQARTCKTTKVCPSAPKPKLGEDQICPGLKCGHLETMKERVACRLKLTPSEMKTEFSILYFPEYCKIEGEWADKKECIKLYQSFGTCWQMPLGEGRQQCARGVVGLRSWADERNQCMEFASKSHSKYAKDYDECKEKLKEKVEHFILFNLYELEVEAEAALTKGKTTVEAVADFEVIIEKKKEELEKAKSIQDWKRIIGQAKTEWRKFKSNLL